MTNIYQRKLGLMDWQLQNKSEKEQLQLAIETAKQRIDSNREYEDLVEGFNYILNDLKRQLTNIDREIEGKIKNTQCCNSKEY